jgi:hypothetical protein
MLGRLLGLSPSRAQARAAQPLARFELPTPPNGRRNPLGRHAAPARPSRQRGPQSGVLYLDEPRKRLDSCRCADVWLMIRGFVADTVTLLLTEQYLEEADHLVRDIIVICNGKVVTTGTPDELNVKTCGQVLQVSPVPGRPGWPRSPPRPRPTWYFMSKLASVTVAGSQRCPSAHLFREFDDKGIDLAESRSVRPT